MNRTDAFDQRVSDWLHADAEHRVPEHLDAVLRRTSTERQRPAWSSLERWLPVQTTLRMTPVPRIAWGLAVLGLVIALGIAVAVVGSRTRQPAPPFGLAANGAIAYALPDGHIYAFDPTTGQSKLILAESDNDAWPWFSKDGSLLKIERETGVPGQVQLVVANADGSNPRLVGPPISDATAMDWSADGSQFAAVGVIDGIRGAYLFDLDGSAPPRALKAPLTIDTMEFRLGSPEFIVTARDAGKYGLYAIHADGSGWREIVTSDEEFTAEMLSPDGSKIAYTTWRANDPKQGVIHVVDVETGDVTTPVFDGVSTADLAPMWSPDSTRLVFERYRDDQFWLAVAPVAGGHVVETGPAHPFGHDGADAQFSPDGTQIFATYWIDGSTWLLDAAGGPGTKTDVKLQSGGSWQRNARP